jgi:hypothetical protein
MKDLFKKIAEKRKDRESTVDGTSSDYAAWGANCEIHPGERKLRIADTEKEKLGYNKEDMVWFCPLCKSNVAYTNSDGTIAQSQVPASADNFHRDNEPITDDGFDSAKEFAKAMGYEKESI